MMRNDTYEILLQCYSQAREGFAIVKDGLVSYTNRALGSMAGEDICGKPLSEVFPLSVAEEINRAFAGKKSEYIECVQVFGRTVDIRVLRHRYEIVLIITDFDSAAQELRKNQESFKILKSAHKRLVDSITSVDSAAELMVKNMAADIPDTAVQWLKMINSSVGNMSSALMDIVEVIESREENADKGCRLEDLTACIEQIAQEMARRFEIKGARLEVSSKPERIVFSVNLKSVMHMMLRLLDYMSDCARTGDTVELCVEGFESHVEISVCDRAGNIPGEYAEFLKNPRVEDMDRIFKAYGNSLYLVRRIAVFYDGSMDAENIGDGKKITVKLPRVQVCTHVQQKRAPLERRTEKPWWERI